LKPRCAHHDSTIERLIESPIPIPEGFVVKNGSNILGMCYGRMPTPESSTPTVMEPSEDVSDLTIRFFGLSRDAIASGALIIRLIMTSCSWILSPRRGSELACYARTASLRLINSARVIFDSRRRKNIHLHAKNMV
jgi:hypothetical protein